jgi:Ni/Co efflux regulator RcnB
MKLAIAASLFLTVATAGIGQAIADERDHDHDHDNHHYVKHDEWHKGATMRKEDWGRGEHVDYRQSHLKAPPRGYEWRMVDGNYVLAAVATGVIASIVAADIAAH